MTSISVAMATYNGERYIREQLDSIARQTTPPCEIVITDDGSTDATLSVAKEFARGATFPVRIHRNEQRLKWTGNFLRAASLCTGDWIAFSDQDDIWVDRKLAVVSEHIRQKPDVSLLIHAVSIVDEEAKPLGYTFPPRPRNESILFYSTFEPNPGHAMVIHSDMVHVAERVRRPSAILYSNNILGHDWLLPIIAAALGKVEMISDELVLYRQHAAQATHEFRAGREGLLHRIDLLRTTFKAEALRVPERFAELADIFDEFSREELEYAARASAASAFYRRQARMYGTRADCYGPNRLGRLRVLAKLAATGCYFSKQRGGLGLSGFVADVIKVVL
jgi:glycosyltransferase involved in cell wall biosynthesis